MEKGKLQGRCDLTVEERIKLQSVVDPTTGCINTIKKASGLKDGDKQKDGYKQIRVNGKLKSIHRVVLELKGIEIPDGYEIDHTCSNRGCINPDHLEVVTHSENCKRAFERGREPSRGSKLTKAKAEEIRDLYAKGDLTHGALARQYQVSESTICSVLNGHRWK